MRIGRIHSFSKVTNSLISYAELIENTAYLLDTAPWLGGVRTGTVCVFDERDLLTPVTPTKIVAVGRNYRAHAAELGNDVPTEPLLFLKPPSSILDPGGTILRPTMSSRVEHEAELAVVIKRRCKNLTPTEAHSAVFGYTIAGDITARDLQRKDVQFTRAKGFDTFCPIGPWIETELDFSHCQIFARVNAQVRQHGFTHDMIFSVPELVAYISTVMTLEPGDVIMTGTPHGVGPLEEGDRLELEIEGIGVLKCQVANALH